MDILKRIANPWIFCIPLCLSLLWSRAKAQQSDLTELPTDNMKSVIVPVFTEREMDVGSIYFTKKWTKGSVELTSHRRIPNPDQPLLFNFDKFNNIIYVINRDQKQWSYPIDSVSAFELMGDGELHSFIKISWISNSYFLMPMYQSEKGYSLYRRLFTKYIRASYSNAGYFTEGKKYDEYVDYYEYYITFPGNTSYRKLALRENMIRRALKEESGLLQEFFSLHDNEINEQSLLAIIQYIDDKKFPE